MLKTIKQFAIGASMIAGVSAIASAPANAFSLSGSDYLLYGTCSPTSTCLSPGADLNTILAGNAASPGGNVELFASSETAAGNVAFVNGTRTSLTGTVAGKNLTLSSLTFADWFGAPNQVYYGASNFANTWFNAFLNAAGFGGEAPFLKAQAFNTFLGIGGFQRSSDPNISYITTSGSDILIGLAGHFDLKAFYAASPNPVMKAFANLLPNGFQASEVVKATIDGTDQFLYSFSATASGLTNSAGAGADGASHSGNYEVALRGVVTPTPESVPEPSSMLGLAAIGGLFAAKRKLNKA